VSRPEAGQPARRSLRKFPMHPENAFPSPFLGESKVSRFIAFLAQSLLHLRLDHDSDIMEAPLRRLLDLSSQESENILELDYTSSAGNGAAPERGGRGGGREISI
jgi:hypothetical protein